MSLTLQVIVGVCLALAGWLVPRWVAGAWRLSWAAAIDAAPAAFVFLVLLAASGRPVLAGAAVLALGGGFAFADRTMRETLREPVVFTALSELPQLFTHPHLYLPFAGTGLVLGGAGAAALGGFVLWLFEPAAMTPHPLAAMAGALVVAALLWRSGREPWLGAVASALRQFALSGEPFADAARLGPVAMPIAHGIIARAERPARRASLPAPAILSLSAARPVVLVQCESLFDARRALPGLPRATLAGYDAACAGGTHGRLVVPAWGANTTRAEFAVLSGIGDAALGYDRFNPYHALARQRVPSWVWRLREAGYRTTCLHAYDRRFFRRDRAMPALGFETFLGRETLGGGRRPPYRSDPELAGDILRVLDREGPRTFVFAITMGNHGPWFPKSSSPPGLTSGQASTAVAPPPQPSPIEGEGVGARSLYTLPLDGGGKGGGERSGLSLIRSGHDELSVYLAGLRRSDEMLQILVDGLTRRGDGAVLGFYGDHLPSLPRAFTRLGFDDWRSDYAIWSAAGERFGRRDLAAHELGQVLVDFLMPPRNSAEVEAVVAEPHPA